jgi:alpha-mannosidase
MEYKLALAQHPMYLLIKEDTQCAERTPPWGSPDIATYIERLRRNIATLRQYPELKIGYEWSGLELECLRQDAPDVFEEMLSLVKAGRTTFYNGTYSQPHLQTLSSEANYRQFEWGERVYRQLCDGHQVRVYAHQESSINEQTPQLLQAFGIRFGVLPHFSSTLVMEQGAELLYHARFGSMFMQGSEFAAWRGLDGTLEPLYLEEPSHMSVQEWLRFQEMLGLLHVPPVMVEIPDLIEVDQQWLAERAQADFALLDDALTERYQAHPPQFQVRFFTNWSYIEGIRAEELSRSNWQAEGSALQAEALNALAFALLRRPAAPTDPIWKKILTTQHHDVYCFCAPELKAKSIVWLHEAEQEASRLACEAANAIAAQVDTSACAGQPLIVFNPTPHEQAGIVVAHVPIAEPVIADQQGQPLPCEFTPTPDGAELRFAASLPGLGYATYQVQAGGSQATEEACADAFAFENDFYRVALRPDGAFTSLQLKPSGEELLRAAQPANLLAARDSTGLGPQHEGTFDVQHWQKWEPSTRGPELRWQSAGPATVRRTPLGVTFTVAGEMGAPTHGVLRMRFYHQSPRIDLDWEFDFNAASIGHFYDDDTKLRVQWPLAFHGDIHHDIAFGVVESRAERPFFPASWVDVSDGAKGLAYFHQGTLKHWLRDDTLVNLFAWGESTDAIGNRLDLVRWPKCFDQRLRGRHALHTAVYPHPGDWRTADVIGAARGYGTPLVAVQTNRHAGPLPAQCTLLKLTDAELVSTCVQVKDAELLCRLYSVKQQRAALAMKALGLRLGRLESIAGEALQEIGPFQIAHLRMAPGG